jgi:hypothetical protein
MQTKIIEFQKYRDFGDLLGDTFAFIRQEYKFLGRVLLTYAGPFVLVSAIANAWAQKSILAMAGLMVNNDPMEILAEFGLKFAILVIAAILSSTVMICVVYSYIKLYVERGKDNFSQEAVWFQVVQKFVPVLLALVAMYFLIFLGMIFCIIPGIYLYVVFALVLSSIILSDKPINASFERSMYLVKENWWFTFGVGLVISIIVGIASYIFTLPSSIMSMFLSVNTISGETSEVSNIIFMILATIGSFAASILAGMPHITLALLYFGMIEKKESPGLLNKIEQINRNEEDNDTINRY